MRHNVVHKHLAEVRCGVCGFARYEHPIFKILCHCALRATVRLRGTEYSFFPVPPQTAALPRLSLGLSMIQPLRGWPSKRRIVIAEATHRQQSNLSLGPAQCTAPAADARYGYTADARRRIHFSDTRTLFLGDYSPPFGGRG